MIGGERRQGELERLRLAVRSRTDVVPTAPRIAHVAAAIEARIGVGDLAPEAGARHADAIVVARHRRHVADDQDGRVARRALAQEGEHRVGAIVADDPAEAVGLAVARMQRRLARDRGG